MTETNKTQTWLVKSSGRILGPYSVEGLIIELRERRVSIIDEVRTPDRRWGFVREYPQFSDIIQFLRDQQSLINEDTGTMFTATKTLTDSGTVEDVSDELTPTPSFLEPEPETPILREVQAAQEKKVPPTRIYEQTYASSIDPRIQRNIQQKKKTYANVAWLLLFCILVGIGITFQMMHREGSKSLGYEEYLRLGKYNRSIGMYDKALEFYRKAESIRPLDSASRLQMAPLLMVVENLNVSARQILEELKTKLNPDPGLRNEIDLYIGISYLREGDLDQAENSMIAITNRDRMNSYAQINRNMIRILKGEYYGAYAEISILLERGIKDPLLLVLRSLAAYMAFSPADNREKLEGAVQDLQRYLGKYQDYKPEASLLVAALQKKIGQRNEMSDTLRGLINSSPTITQEHIHSLQMDRQVLSWDYLYRVCRDIQQGLDQMALTRAMLSYCHYQRNEFGVAIDIFQKLRNQYSNENVFYAFHAFLLATLGRADEASAVLKLPKAMESVLAQEVAAQLCMSDKDWTCGERIWNEVLAKDPTNLKALAGLATIAFERGKKEQAKDMVRRGSLVSENYRPLVELKDKTDAL